MKKYFYLIILLCFFVKDDIQAQLNVRVGATSSFLDARLNNQIINIYNDDHPWFEDKMNRLYLMHGVQIGLRFKTNFLAMEAGWERLNRRRTAYGIDPDTDILFTNELSYYVNSFFIGLDNYIGSVGYGAHIGVSNYSAKTEVPNSRKQVTYLRDQDMHARFFLNIRIVEYSNFSSYIKPFVQMPLTKINYSEFAENMIPDSKDQLTNFQEGMWFYGITLAFYNGPQE